MSGPLRLVPGGAANPGATADPGPPLTRRRTDGDPLDELADRLGAAGGAAVHPDEIAAVLEADGLTDERVAARYGRQDAFEIAAELYARVPRTYPEPPAAPDPWRVRPWWFLLRGLVFALPGLGYVLAAPALTGVPDRFGTPAGTAALAASALTGWAWNQALAHRAFTRMAAGGRGAAARSLRTGAIVGALLAFAAALAFPGPGAAVAFAAGQSVYLAAATVLLVLGRERDLLLALAPVTAGAAALSATGLPMAVRTALLLATVGAVVLAAVRETRRAEREGAGASREGGGPGIGASVPYGLFGLGCAGLTTLAVLGDIAPRDGGGPTAAGPAVAALTLSMGAAEWLLHRFRSLSLAALAHSRSTTGLLLRMLRVLAPCLAGYLAALAVLLLALAALWPHGPPPGAPRILAVLALGAVLWTGLLLQAFGSARIPAAVCLAAACAEAAAVLTLTSPGPVAAQILVRCCAAAALLTAAAVLLGRPTTHR